VNWTKVAASADHNTLLAVSHIDSRDGESLQTSTDAGATWKRHDEIGLAYWGGISVSANGKKLAASQNTGTIFTSVDGGKTWTERAEAGSANWNSIAYSGDGSTLAAVSGSLIVVSHDDGQTWDSYHPGSRFMDWASVAMPYDGSRIAATTTDGQLFIYDGSTWVNENALGVRAWAPLRYSDDGTLLSFRVFGNLGMDIATWRQDGSSPVVQQTSTDGNVPEAALSGDGKTLIAGTYSGHISTATLAGDSPVTWTQQNTPAGDWHSITSSPDGRTSEASAFIYGSTNHPDLYRTTDGGATWSNLTPQDPCIQQDPPVNN
jgi:photosystem II stability/assembly factor-like uncharacterized protein